MAKKRETCEWCKDIQTGKMPPVELGIGARKHRKKCIYEHQLIIMLHKYAGEKYNKEIGLPHSRMEYVCEQVAKWTGRTAKEIHWRLRQGSYRCPNCMIDACEYGRGPEYKKNKKTRKRIELWQAYALAIGAFTWDDIMRECKFKSLSAARSFRRRHNTPMPTSKRSKHPSHIIPKPALRSVTLENIADELRKVANSIIVYLKAQQ